VMGFPLHEPPGQVEASTQFSCRFPCEGDSGHVFNLIMAAAMPLAMRLARHVFCQTRHPLPRERYDRARARCGDGLVDHSASYSCSFNRRNESNIDVPGSPNFDSEHSNGSRPQAAENWHHLQDSVLSA
jgi:hypothetical protein